MIVKSSLTFVGSSSDQCTDSVASCRRPQLVIGCRDLHPQCYNILHSNIKYFCQLPLSLQGGLRQPGQDPRSQAVCLICPDMRTSAALQESEQNLPYQYLELGVSQLLLISNSISKITIVSGAVAASKR